MTTPEGQQLPETPGVDPAAGAMVRVCERCGTVCSTDQEWCLSCGVRMTESTQRLPGLRAAGMVVALAVLLAGGAAAASYAALRGNTTPAASVAPETMPTPATTPPAATTPPVTTTPPATTPSTATPPPTSSGSSSDDDLSGLGGTTGSSSTGSSTGTGSSSAGTGSTGSSTGTTTGGSTSTGSSSTSTGSSSTDSSSTSGSGTTSGSGNTGSTGKGKDEDASGPVTFASGQGSLYDPDGVVADRGDEGRAIDGNVKTSWQVTLNPGATGGFGYVLDFDRATALQSLQIVTVTKGVSVKVLGTKKATLPADQLSNGWDTLAEETTLKTSAAGTTIQLQPVSGKVTKYKHILVWITKAPAAPAQTRIKEFIASR